MNSTNESIHFCADSETDTDRLGQVLADMIPDGTTVALIGTLGSGKTRLVQSIAAACGLDREQVVSPTFVLCQPYQGRRLLYHMDAYRIKDDDEFLELGPDEYFESEGITFVEWADRVMSCLPPQRVEIHIDVKGDTSREFQIRVTDNALSPVLEQIRQRCSA